MIGIVVFSFGARENEIESSCLSNLDLAESTFSIVRHEHGKVVLVAQGEVASVLTQLYPIIETVHPDLVVLRHHKEGEYLDSDEVMRQATKFFLARGVRRVIVVAQPWLHLRTCRRAARKYGFTVVKRKIGRIRFDKDSVQWWTRGPIRTLLYGLIRPFYGPPPVPFPAAR